MANKKETVDHCWLSDGELFFKHPDTGRYESCDFNRRGTKCSCCKDNIKDTDILRTAPDSTMCRVCSDEILLGKILNQNISFFGGRSDYNNERYEDDISPSQSNAIRAMEGTDGIFDDIFI